MKQCPKCNAEHTKSGKYCSRKCANSKVWTEEQKKQRSETLKQFIIDNPSWKENQLAKMPERINSLKKTLHKKHEVRFTEGEIVDRGCLKRWLVKTQGEVCSICAMPPIWNNMPLSLQVDHINGINNDNRPENLRLVCPNCHSQTETFAGKNNKNLGS